MTRNIRLRATAFIFSLLIAAGSFSASADTFRDSLKTALTQATNPTDSLRICFDLLDTAPNSERLPYVKDIYRLAVRTHNLTAQLEMLRRLANLTQTDTVGQDSLLTRYEALAKALPSFDRQRGTVTFIEMIRATNKSRILSDTARREFFRREIASYPGDDKSDITDQILHHYTICLMLGGDMRSPLLSSNVDHLTDLVRKLPYQMESIRSIVFTQAARMYTLLGDKQRAIAADREMLRGIRAMQQRYEKEGRRHREYSTNIYSCYRRMLMNYEALAPGESDSIYTRLTTMAQFNPDVAADMKDGRIDAFYLMSKGRYKEAIPALRNLVESNAMPKYHSIVLRALWIAATQAGDQQTLLYVMPLYINDLESRNTREKISQIMDNELSYRMADYERTNTELGTELNARGQHIHNITVIAAGILTIVLLTVIFIIYRLYVKSKRLSRSLTQSNAALTLERDKMKRSQRDLIAARDRANKASALKTDFINNMSREVSAPLAAIVEYSQFIVDNMDSGRRKYMQTFADVVVLSAELLQTLINDVLDTSSIEKAQVEINKRPVSITGICNMVVGNFRHRMKPGVELEFINPSATDTIITTDPQRVEQVLINLVSNATKFTEEGSVTLTYEFDDDLSHLTFSVTDTGIGIPQGKEQLIFERFEKLDTHTQGSGLGLYICSLICKLLDGSIKVDTDYTDGARFLFTIPV